MLKVIGGEFRGRNLASVPGETTRPPLARVRGAVANILAPVTEGARVLDMFAGTGSFSIELLSRGADTATCIDKDPSAVEVIKKNVKTLGLSTRVEVILGDSLLVVRRLEASARQYDIILVAPPYFSGLDVKSMDFLGQSDLIAPGGVVVLQQHKRENHIEQAGNLKRLKFYSYGDTVVSTFVLTTQDV